MQQVPQWTQECLAQTWWEETTWCQEEWGNLWTLTCSWLVLWQEWWEVCKYQVVCKEWTNSSAQEWWEWEVSTVATLLEPTWTISEDLKLLQVLSEVPPSLPVYLCLAQVLAFSHSRRMASRSQGESQLSQRMRKVRESSLSFSVLLIPRSRIELTRSLNTILPTTLMCLYPLLVLK